MNAPAQTSLAADDVDLGELAQTLGFMLRMAQIVSYEDLFRDFPQGNVLPGEFTVMWVIGLNPDIRQGDLARALRIKRAHMTKLVKRMIAAGLVRRRVAPEDRRAILLSLTDRGRTEICARRAVFFKGYSREGTHLTRGEFDTLLDLLRKFTGIARVAQ